MNKTAIFVIGDGRVGKSTLIRSLTGAARNQIYNVKNRKGKTIRIFVSLNSPQEMGMSNYPPANFPESIEQKYEVKRDDYDVFISALRLAVRDQVNYGYKQYINSVKNKGFDVKISVVERSWDNKRTPPAELSEVISFAKSTGSPNLKLNALNDPNAESSKLKVFYP